jgi:hypothetical protein
MRNRKKSFKRFDTHFVGHFSIFIIFFVLVSGCGKKAPPVPPRQAKPPIINDVCVNINRATPKLKRTIPGEKGMIIPNLSDCIAYSLKMFPSDSNFKNSPVFLKYISDSLIEVNASQYMKKLLLRTPNPLKRIIGISIM